MTPFSFILSLLEKLPPLLSATTRLVRATKASEPPPMEQGAEAYLRGANDEAFRQEQRDRLRWKMDRAANDEPVEEEKPSLP